MSAIIAIRDNDVLVLGTDSRFMAADGSRIAADDVQKVFEIAPSTFIATSGRLVACEYQTKRARELAVKLGTNDVRVIAAALERESQPCLAALVSRLRAEPDEMTRAAVDGRSLLHGCTLAGRTAGGALGFVHHDYRVQTDGSIGCAVESCFGEGPRRIVATSGAPEHLFRAFMSQVGQNLATWISPPEQVVVGLLDALKQSFSTIGGISQVVCLDSAGSHWISRPPQAAPLVGDLAAANIVATIGIASPVISGGSMTGTSLSVTSAAGVETSITPASSGVIVRHGTTLVLISQAGVYVQDGGVLTSLAVNGLSVFGNQVVGQRQTGPGNPFFSDLSNAQTWCQNLLNALRTHGLVT